MRCSRLTWGSGCRWLASRAISCRIFDLLFRHAQYLVGGDIVEGEHCATGPGDFDFGAVGVAEAKVQAGIVAGQIAAAGLALLRLAHTAGRDHHAGPEGVGVRFAYQ